MQNGLSVPQGAALTLGAMLGTGVISLPALAAGVAGPASLVAWGALVLLSVPLATTFAALGARHPDGGGVATYARLAFGERAATMVGWAFYATIPVGAPAAAGFAGAYVADATGGSATTTATASSSATDPAMTSCAVPETRRSNQFMTAHTAMIATVVTRAVPAPPPVASAT